MRAEERPDGVALPASRFGDLGGGRTVFPPQKFLPCCPRGPGFLPGFRGCCHLLRAPLVPARSVFSRFANRFSVCDLWSDSGKVFHVFQHVAIFRDRKTWLDARERRALKTRGEKKPENALAHRRLDLSKRRPLVAGARRFTRIQRI